MTLNYLFTSERFTKFVIDKDYNSNKKLIRMWNFDSTSYISIEFNHYHEINQYFNLPILLIVEL